MDLSVSRAGRRRVRGCRAWLWAAAWAAVLCGGFPAAAAEHPFILWTEEDAAALRKRVETQPWAKAAYEKLVEDPDRHERNFANLFRYAVMGDSEAGEQEKKELTRMVRSPFPQGAAQYINVLRYDQLYGLLTPGERREVEDCFRNYIEQIVFRRAIFDKSVFNDSRNYSRYDARTYSRSNWLPNITWPWKVSANLMALALVDEELIRRTWSVRVIQDCALRDPKSAALRESWYAKRIGVRMTMLGEPGTTGYAAATAYYEPMPRRPDPGLNEVGGATIAAARKCPRTAFVARHEPLKAASPRITEFRRIGQNEHGLAVAVVGRAGSGIDDRVMLRYGDDADKPIRLGGEGESFTFADHAYVRIGKDRVEVCGHPQAMEVRVGGEPRLVVNGAERDCKVADGLLTYVN